MNGVGARLTWALGQVVAYSMVWIWISQRLRSGNTPEQVDLIAGLVLLCLVAVFGFIGSKTPFANVASGRTQIQLPIDPIGLTLTFAALVVVGYIEVQGNSLGTPCNIFLVAGTALLASALRKKPDRVPRNLVSLLLIASIFMYVGYQYEVLKPPHSPGTAKFDMFMGGVWIVLPIALGIWTAVYESTSSKMALLGLIIVSLASLAATFVLAVVGSILGLWLCMVIPIFSAGYRLINHLTVQAAVSAEPIAERS